MKKLSKSDTLDKEQEQRDKDSLNNPTLSLHFAVDTFVMYQNKRYKIEAYHGDWVILRSEDDKVALFSPYFMR